MEDAGQAGAAAHLELSGDPLSVAILEEPFAAVREEHKPRAGVGLDAVDDALVRSRAGKGIVSLK